jgi:hypothetical protein
MANLWGIMGNLYIFCCIGGTAQLVVFFIVKVSKKYELKT